MFEKILVFLGSLKMKTPVRWGWFHLMWFVLSAIIIAIFAFYKIKGKKMSDKMVFGIYGYGSLLLEVTKQLIWSVSFEDGVYLWDYNWYAAPFQLCTTPMFVSIALTFVKNDKVKKYLLSYLGLFTIISSLSVMLLPDSCFTRDILINIHTMYLHFGSFVIALYIHIFNKVELNYQNLFKGFIIFMAFVATALLLDVVVYKSGLCGDETFNMFYISPYFNSSLPVFCDIQPLIPYPLFLVCYILALFAGSNVVMWLIRLIKRLKK